MIDYQLGQAAQQVRLALETQNNGGAIQACAELVQALGGNSWLVQQMEAPAASLYVSALIAQRLANTRG